MLFSLGSVLACAQKDRHDEHGVGFAMSLGATGLLTRVLVETYPMLCSSTHASGTLVWSN